MNASSISILAQVNRLNFFFEKQVFKEKTKKIRKDKRWKVSIIIKEIYKAHSTICTWNKYIITCKLFAFYNANGLLCVTSKPNVYLKDKYVIASFHIS